MKRRILSIIMALALCLGLCPAGARAAEEPENRTVRTPRAERLVLTNQDAENAAEGWSWKQTDADGYCYKLTLDNVNFDVSDYSVITFSMDKSIWLDTITIELIGENRVTSTHQSENTYDGCGILLDTSSSRPPLKIVVSGSGSLTAEGWQCGISLGTDELHFDGVTVNAQAIFPSGLSVTNGGSLLIENSEVSTNTVRATSLTARNSNISVILRSLPDIWTYAVSLVAADSIDISGGSLTLAGSKEKPAYKAIFNNRQTSIDLSGCQIDIRNVEYGLEVIAGTINLTDISGAVFCTAESIYNTSINNSNPAFSANTVNSSGCSIYAQTGADILIYGDCSLPSEITELTVSGDLIIETDKAFTIGAGQKITFSKNSAQICQYIDNTTLVNNGTLEFIYQPEFRSGTKLVNNGTLIAPKGIGYGKTAQVTNNGTFNGIVKENSGFTQYIYGNVALERNDALGVLNGSTWMISKTFIMPGAVLTIPNGKTLDASQEERGLTWESLSQYLSVGEGGKIVVEEGGVLLLPPNPTQEQIDTLPVEGDGVIKFGEAVLCTVVFDSQGGSAVGKQTVLSGNSATEPSAPTRDGYIFGGWYTESGCETAWDFETDTVTADTTLYAKWMQISVEGVSLNKSSLTLTVGSSERLTATVVPGDAANKAVTWTSSNPAVATVDSSGNVTAVSEGTAAITVVTSDGGKTAGCTLTVKAQTVPPSETETKLEIVEGITEVPEGLKSISTLDTPAKLELAMRTKVTQTGVPSENTAVYDVTLMISTDGGRTWTPATRENFPAGGLTVTLPYPTGTNSSYTFTVVHMFTTSDFGKTPGDTETPAVTNTADGLRFTVTGLSPISVGWTTPATNPDSPSSGNHGGGGGGSVSTYAVTVEKSEHGKVTSNRTNASSGSTVTLMVTPDSGYVLDALTVTDSRGNEIRLTTQGGGKYTFTMPDRAVTVKAAYAPLSDDRSKPCDGGADCPSYGFTDLGSVGTWYHEAVDYVLRNHLMDGYGNGTFGPNNNLTRAQFAKILFNKEGRPVVNYLLQYGDVAEGAWYTEAIRWAASRGIVGGYGNGTFGPNDKITREQLAVMLWRYAGSPAATEKELHFTDADKASGYALEALRWAVENGILGGYGDGRLDPAGLATRAQSAQMLKNLREGKT